MKVLYVSHESGLNGAPKSLLEFVTKIKDKDVQPIVVIPNRGKLKAELDKRKIDTRIVAYRQCVYHDECSVNDYVNYYKKNISAVRKLIQIIEEENIDLIHSNSLAVDVGAVAAYIAKTPHVWHFREFLLEDFNLRFINPLMDKWLIRKSACCIAISKSVKEKSRARYSVKPICLYNGIDKKLYYSPVQESQNKTGKIKLIIAGVISERKGQWDAIRAVEILLKKGTDVNLMIVGNGDPLYVNHLKKYIKQRNMSQHIIFIPYTKDLLQLRLSSDIIFVCSKMEAFGRVTAEAMIAGKIVLGVSSGGTQELIGEHEERGYLYTWNRPEELSEKIEYIIAHPREVLEKERKAQDFAMRLTDLDAYTDKLRKIYQEVLDNKN